MTLSSLHPSFLNLPLTIKHNPPCPESPLCSARRPWNPAETFLNQLQPARHQQQSTPGIEVLGGRSRPRSAIARVCRGRRNREERRGRGFRCMRGRTRGVSGVNGEKRSEEVKVDELHLIHSMRDSSALASDSLKSFTSDCLLRPRGTLAQRKERTRLGRGAADVSGVEDGLCFTLEQLAGVEGRP